jgi:hypothetical protein
MAWDGLMAWDTVLYYNFQIKRTFFEAFAVLEQQRTRKSTQRSEGRVSRSKFVSHE